MKIKLRTYDLVPLDLKDKEHNYVINRLASEQKVKDYISKNLVMFVKEPNNKDEVTENGTYIIEKNDEIIGLVGTKNLDSRGILELWIALNPSDSGHGNGTRIFEEITPHLIEKINNLNDIRFVIDKNNLPSKKAAIKAGYNYISTNDDGKETYHYFGK